MCNLYSYLKIQTFPLYYQKMLCVSNEGVHAQHTADFIVGCVKKYKKIIQNDNNKDNEKHKIKKNCDKKTRNDKNLCQLLIE